MVKTLFWYILKGTVFTHYVTRNVHTWKDLAVKCALEAKGDIHFPDFPENHACVTGTSKKVFPFTRAGPHCWHLKTFLVHIQIAYIHCIYIRIRTLHECSLALAALRAAALARSLLRHYTRNVINIVVCAIINNWMANNARKLISGIISQSVQCNRTEPKKTCISDRAVACRDTSRVAIQPEDGIVALAEWCCDVQRPFSLETGAK